MRDAFGLPLQASQTTFWTLPLETAFQGPRSDYRNLLMIEPAG